MGGEAVVPRTDWERSTQERGGKARFSEGCQGCGEQAVTVQLGKLRLRLQRLTESYTVGSRQSLGP